MPLLALLACQPPQDSTHQDSEIQATPPELHFRFAVFADPHISSPNDDHNTRLQHAIDWINDSTPDLDLRLVLVVGDIGWNTEGLPLARNTLDTLQIPYIPITGDNEVQLGSEALYAETFTDHYQNLTQTFPDFRAPDGAIENPETGELSYFSNLAFTYQGLHFIGLDWASRVLDPLLGETGYLHDFPGGTLPFFREELENIQGSREQVVLFSHIPMHMSPGGMDITKNDTIQALIAPYQDAIWADLAGHYHVSADEAVGGYHLYVTDATWDDTVDIRIIEVYKNNLGFSYQTVLVVAD